MDKIIKTALCAALAVLMTIFGSALPVSAEGYICTVLDLSGVMELDEEMDLRNYLTTAANDIGCNIIVTYVRDLYGDSPNSYAQRQIFYYYGENGNAASLLICDDPAGYHCIELGGAAADRYSDKTEDILTEVRSALAADGYAAAGYKFAEALGAEQFYMDSTDPDAKTSTAAPPNRLEPSGSYSVVIKDTDGVINAEDERELTELLARAALLAKCNMGIIITDDLNGEQPRRVADVFLDEQFGADSDAIVMLLTADPNGYNWLSFSEQADINYGYKINDIFDAVYEGLAHGYVSGIKAYCAYFGVEKGETIQGFSVRLEDRDNSLTSSEEEYLLGLMQETANEIECNVGVVITDQLNGKSEKRYTDDFADESFGTGSDNAVLLLNNDTEIDYFSAFGKGTDLYKGYDDPILANVQDALKKDGFSSAVEAYCNVLTDIADGKEIEYTEYDYSINFDYNSERDGSILFDWVVPFVVGIAVAAMITAGFASGYRKKAPVSAKAYMDSGRTRVLNREDIFVREYTTSHKISSSSGGGGGSRRGGGGRSRGGRSGGGRRR